MKFPHFSQGIPLHRYRHREDRLIFPGKLGRLAPAIFLFCAAWLSPGYAAEPIKEYDVKAVFLYNFAKFVEWPDAVVGQVRLCLLGVSPFGKAFDALRGQPVKDRRFDVTAIDSPSAVSGCNMVFVPYSQEKNLDKVLSRARGNGVLVISDSEGFAQRGAMINLYVEDEKVRFEINLHAIESSGLKVSSKLLTLGKPANSQ